MAVPVAIHPCADYRPERVGQALERLLDDLGGLKQLVDGKRVLIKPNFLVPRRAERAVTTHPVVIAALAEASRRAGARSVVVADSPAVGRARRVARKLGLPQLLEPLGAEVADLVEEVEIERPPPFVKLKLARLVTEAEVVLNLAKLKTHALCGLTLAVKNCFGCVVGLGKAQWHVRAHADVGQFSRLLVEICRTVHPALNIVDAVVAMDGNGPGSGRARPAGFLAASADPFVLDRVLADMCGVSPAEVSTFAHDGLGQQVDAEFTGARPQELALRDWKMPRSRSRGLRRIPWLSNRLVPTPRFHPTACSGCGQCVKLCPVDALSLEAGRVRLDSRRCVHCLCCQETCPEGAVTVRRGWLHR